MTRPPRGDADPPEEVGRPPLLVRLLLWIILPREGREFFLGDLEEAGRRPWLRELAGAVALRFDGRRSRRSPSTAAALTTRSSAPMSSHVFSDLRLGLRRLARTPGASLTVVTALSVGIGLSALMFSLIEGGLLPTLPFEDGDRIVQIRRVEFAPISGQTFEYWSERQTSFVGLGATRERSVNLAIEGEGSEPVRRAAMSVGSLSLLSTRPVLGRWFEEADAVPGAPAVVVVGHDTWQNRLDADPDALGRVVRVGGVPAEIIGVMPEGFGFPYNEQLWTPLQLDALRPDDVADRVAVFGMLREGVDRAEAARELTALDEQRPRPATEAPSAPVEVVAYTDIMNPTGASRVVAGLMLGVAFLVLLVACANAANVLLAQAAVRGREVAVRTALGASRLRIVGQFWAEVTLLAVSGAVGGAVLAGVGIRLVQNALPPDGAPFWLDFGVDLPVLLFTAAAAVVAAMLAGVLPAVHASRVDRHDLLKDASRGTSSHRLGKVMGRLIGAEMALCFVLLVSAGLFVRSALNLQDFDFTFDPEGVYTARARLPDIGFEDAGDRAVLIERLEEALAAIPGVTSVTAATELPGVGGVTRPVVVEGLHDPSGDDLPTTRHSAVTGGFFQTHRASLLEGRTFDFRDRENEPPVAIVSASFQRMYMPGGALGRRVALPRSLDGGDPADLEWRTVVGVAPDLLAGGLGPDLVDAVYVPITQEAPETFFLAARSSTAATDLAAPMRETVAEVDPDVALSYMRPLDESIALANAQYGWLSALFLTAGSLALFLAGIGLYGVMAFWVAQRGREIGVRMAMGGGRSTIIGLVLRQGMTRIIVGLAIGLALSVPAAWLLRGSLLQVAPFDPLVFGTVLVVLLGAAWLGCIVPALRATRVDPQVALSAE